MEDYILSARVLEVVESTRLVHDTNFLGFKKNHRIELIESNQWVLKTFHLTENEVNNPIVRGLFESLFEGENIDVSCKLMFNTGKDNVKNIQLEQGNPRTSYIKTEGTKK